MNKNTIYYITHGSIFERVTEAVVVPVNCYGVMGKGLALKFKNKYPDMYLKYYEACKLRKLFIGQPLVWQNKGHAFPEWIICIPTKIHWQSPSDYRYITAGAQAISKVIKRLHITSIGIPALGCGLGGLDFNKVLEIIQNQLYGVEAKIYIYPPKEKGSWKKNNY